MIDLVFANGAFDDIARRFRDEERESAAIVLANRVERPLRTRLLVSDVFHPVDSEYVRRSRVSVELHPGFVANIVKQARVEGKVPVFIHSHPFESGVPHFSPIDDESEQALRSHLEDRIGNPTAFSILIGREACIARVLGTSEPVGIVEVGQRVQMISHGDPASGTDHSGYSRQVAALGAQGQARLRKLSVGIVGLGGTGSVLAQQLAYLGIRRYVLIDPDTIESSNLNRTVGATVTSIGRAKVDITSEMIRSIQPDAEINGYRESINLNATALRLTAVDTVFGCTDSQGSRAILGQLAYQYLIPLFDVGVAIVVAPDGRVTHIAGRAQMFAPGLGCYVCGQELDWDAVRRDLMTDYERQSDPYFIGPSAPQPAVVSLNSVVASLAANMFLSALTELPGEGRLLFYDGVSSRVRSAAQPSIMNCVVCSKTGALARGDSAPLPGRTA